MRTLKPVLIMAIMAAFALLLPCTHALAGGAEEPPTSGTIEGPELWGEIVIDCAQFNVYTIRVKRIQDCNVQTQAIVIPSMGCPTDASQPVNKMLSIVLFDINEYTDPPTNSTLDKTPIITRVKNFKQEPGQSVYSFDAQIKFWVP